MDFRRFNISQLAIETNTSRTLLSKWVKDGLLVPTQIVGNRLKFSIEAFEKAEKLHNSIEINEASLLNSTIDNNKNYKADNKKKRSNKILDSLKIKVGAPIPQAFWDSL